MLQFTPADQIDALYLERPYYVAPDETGVKAYQVLSKALEDTGRVGVGLVTIRNIEGKDIAVAPEPEERPSKVTDLMEALRASVEATESRKSA